MACIATPTYQLNDPTTPLDGLDCTADVGAMIVARATCNAKTPHAGEVRRLCRNPDGTPDTTGGTNFPQVRDAILRGWGVRATTVTPIDFGQIPSLLKVRPVGVQIDYSPLVGTKWDCFKGNFSEGHAIYLDRLGKLGPIELDPGADGRNPGVPKGYQEIPWDLLRRAAGALKTEPLRDPRIVVGLGKAYVLLGPLDPAPGASPHYRATVTVKTSLWNPSTKRWVYNGPNGIKVGTVLEVRGATYYVGPTKVRAVPVVLPYGGYFVPTAHIKIGARVG